MEKNVGKRDKLIRLAAGAILIILGAVWPCWICAILGLILIITGVLQKCPAYKLMGKSTCEVKK
jgi:membrane-bound ClpP family serine protease